LTRSPASFPSAAGLGFSGVDKSDFNNNSKPSLTSAPLPISLL